MKVVRMYTGKDRRTHFQDVRLAFKRDRATAKLAELLPRATGRASVRVATGTMPDFHTAPWKRYLVILEGSVDFVSTNGTSRSLKAGDIVLVEDTEGEGHIVRLNGCDRYTFLFIPIAD